MDAGPAAPAPPVTAHWLGRIAYREAWELQKRLAGARAEGRIGDQLLLLEHPSVLTLGRGADPSHVLASPEQLASLGIELLHVERGGEVTYHGPGQLVAYPIVRLADRGLLLRPFVRALEAGQAATCAALGVPAGRREGHPGCWVEAPDGPRKIGALGIRVERGVSYHGISLNVAVDLAGFSLIDPCGMPGLVSTSIEAEAEAEAGEGSEEDAARDAARTPAVARAGAMFARAFADAIGSPLTGMLPTGDAVLDVATAAAARSTLDRLLAGDVRAA